MSGPESFIPFFAVCVCVRVCVCYPSLPYLTVNSSNSSHPLLFSPPVLPPPLFPLPFLSPYLLHSLLTSFLPSLPFLSPIPTSLHYPFPHNPRPSTLSLITLSPPLLLSLLSLAEAAFMPLIRHCCSDAEAEPYIKEIKVLEALPLAL
jgi:hypothetical protein